jgi:septum formation protein
MRAYARSEIERYVERGEPYDKAGGYAVQDAEFSPVERLDGCYLNVVGLPLCAAARGLQTLGAAVAPASDWTPPCGYCAAGAPLVARGLPE